MFHLPKLIDPNLVATSDLDPLSCKEVRRQIANLHSIIHGYQEQLQTASTNDKPVLADIIRDLLDELPWYERRLEYCIEEPICNLTIVGVEQTQGIQYFSINGQGSGYAPDNTVPLIAQRSLILRVYLDNKRESQSTLSLPMSVTGQVIVDRILTDGSKRRIANLSPINGAILARSSAAIDRGNSNHTLNFRLDPVDCQGLLRFTVMVFEQPPVVFEGSSRASEHATYTSTIIPQPIGPVALDSTIASSECANLSTVVYGRFEPVPTFRVRAVLIHYTGDGMDIPAPNGLDFAKTLEYIMRTYPIGRLEFVECVEVEFDGDLSAPGGGCGPGWEGLIGLLQDMANGSDDNAIHVALVPQGASSPYVLGCGNTGVAVAFDGDGDVLAQEIGHAFSRKHAPSGGALGADPDYPTYNNYPMGSIGEFGFDTSTSDVYNPTQSFDFMGYRSNRWISPYTYMGLRDAMVERFGDISMARLLAGDRRDTLFLKFRVNRDGTVQVLPSFHLPAVVQSSRSDSLSEISCELLDQSGTVLKFHRCRLTESPQDKDGPHVVFHEAFAWIEQAVAIRFLRNREVLHIHKIEGTVPKVEILSPKIQCQEREVTLKWTGHHVDTELTYMIRYSNDGGATWRVVAANLRDTTSQVKPRLLSGGDQCLLQVVASSGIRTSMAQTEPFSSPLKPRTASIISPEQGTEVHNGEHLLLRGGAFSPDFGLGDMEDAVWSSNIEGRLGRGFELVADNLSSGFHTITLTVPDGIGGVTTAFVMVRVRDRVAECNR